MAGHRDHEQVLVGVFAAATPLEPLIDQARQAGVPDEAIEILSPLPLSDRLLRPRVRVPLYVVTVIAGLVGIGVGIFFAGGTAALYPLPTGGKPIVAPPVVGIISFETMMLVAIVSTFVAMVIRVRMSGTPAAGYDLRIDEGALAVVARLDRDDPRLASIETRWRDAGAVDVRRVDETPVFPMREPLPHRSTPVLLLLLPALWAAACSQDMQEQPSYQPQEAPRVHSPAVSVPLDSRAFAPAPLPRTESRLKLGARLFAVNCAHCHGSSGAGDGPVAGYLKDLPANLRAPRVQNKPEADIYDIVTNGKDAMPSFKGELSAVERWAAAYYVKALGGGGLPPPK